MSLRDEINAFIPGKDNFYDFLIRKRFYLPLQKCNIITVKFLDLVYRELIYIPKFEEVRPIRIASAPSRKELQNELIRVMLSLNPAAPGMELVNQLKKKDADSQWLTSMLFMIDPNHEYFSFSYSRAKK